jgi:hypothetical protein
MSLALLKISFRFILSKLKKKVMKIRHLLEIDWKVVENYSYYHEANQLTDVLVNHSCSLISSCVFFNDCPSAFKHLLLADVLRGYNLVNSNMNHHIKWSMVDQL